MNHFEAETFVVPKKNIRFTIWEDNERLMMTCEHYNTVDIGFNSTDAEQVSLEDLKHIFRLCGDERPCYSLGGETERGFCIQLNSPGECRYIYLREYHFGITVEFVTMGLYVDKSDPRRWKKKIHTSEIGEEHKLTCRDLYRIKKMCNISDI